MKQEDRIQQLEEKIPLLVGNIKGLCDMIGALSARVNILEAERTITARAIHNVSDQAVLTSKAISICDNRITKLEVESTYITSKNLKCRMEAMEVCFSDSIAAVRDLVAQVNIKATSPLEKKTPKASPVKKKKK